MCTVHDAERIPVMLYAANIRTRTRMSNIFLVIVFTFRHVFLATALKAIRKHLGMTTYLYKCTVPTTCQVCTTYQCLSDIPVVESQVYRPRFYIAAAEGRVRSVGGVGISQESQA